MSLDCGDKKKKKKELERPKVLIKLRYIIIIRAHLRKLLCTVLPSKDDPLLSNDSLLFGVGVSVSVSGLTKRNSEPYK